MNRRQRVESVGTVSKPGRVVIKLELSYLTLYNGECEETRWSFA